nr:hypothetical protein [Tanacetum cinerariifolium]
MVDTPVISLHALTRESTYKTMRGKAYVGKHTVHSLIDSGSTHTFLDLKVAKKLGYKLKATCPMHVSVANGQVMNSSYQCKGFKWTLQGVKFTSDVLILPLGGCEMVLGVQWLSILGGIRWNFKDLVMKFVYNNKRMVLRGTHKAALQWTSGKKHKRKLKAYRQTMLLESYQEVFAAPTSLPPKRKQDHRIPLLPNTLPINIRPYKYPPSQKDVVEAMVKELMESGVIRDSQRYHQIRMHEDDIGITAFRTHEEHYEFLVMPFGLTNAPSTFQSLMNTVFKPFLRYFTLVFFDDILIYSATLKEHLQHLKLVLQAMQWNSLYAKMIKCVFATNQVEYLGHIISEEGVFIDPIAMKRWPTPVNVKQLRGFLGLTGYYRRFIKNYAIISKPLTILLKKNSFTWNLDAQSAFETLKTAMSQALVLALPNFNKPFTVESDASGLGIGAVLQQGGHPIAYLKLRRKGKLVVRNDEKLRKKLVTYFHSNPVGGHSGVQVTVKKIVWHDISMDFIEALSPSQGKTVPFVVVDRLSKYAYFILISHPFTGSQVAQVFMDHVYKLHASTSSSEEVGRTMQAREQAIAMLQFHLKRSQDRIKNMSDKKRSDRTFKVGMRVYLKLQTYRQATTRQGLHHKFAAKFYRPFLILTKVGKVAYRLQLPENSQIHHVFHVSQLNLCKGTNHQVGFLPECGPDRVLSVEPEAIIGKRLGKLHNKAVLYVLVKWVNQAEEDATWGLYTDLIKRRVLFNMLLGYLSFLYNDSLMLTASFGDSAVMATIIAYCFMCGFFYNMMTIPILKDHGDDGVLKSKISGCGKFPRTKCLLGMVCENFRGQRPIFCCSLYTVCYIMKFEY